MHTRIFLDKLPKLVTLWWTLLASQCPPALPMTVIFPLLFIRVVLSYSSLPGCMIFSDVSQSSAQQRRCSLFKQTRTLAIPHRQTKHAVWQSFRLQLFRSITISNLITSSALLICFQWASPIQMSAQLSWLNYGW